MGTRPDVDAGTSVLVTGASRGIGRSVALAFSELGAMVALGGRDVDALEGVVDDCHAAGASTAIALPFDVTDEAACGEAAARCIERFGSVEVLVNNAGVSESAKFTDTSLEQWRRIMAVDVEGPFVLTRTVLPGMLERGRGSVVFVASSAARIGMPYVAAYTAAKHAVLGLTRSLAAEYATSGVTFNCVCPSYVDTPMTETTIANIVSKTGRPADQARATLLNPQQRLIEPAEVAAICVLLASEAGRSINGQGINIDGGAVQC